MPWSNDAERDWRAFVDNANWDSLHPLDWERLYEFLVGIHVRRDDPGETSVRQRMTDEIPSGGARTSLWLAYQVGRELLPYYDQRRRA